MALSTRFMLQLLIAILIAMAGDFLLPIAAQCEPGIDNSTQAKSSVSPEAKKALIDLIVSDDPDLQGCLGKGGLSSREKFAEGFDVEPFDLNRDGKPEFILRPFSPCLCGAQNCTMWVVKQMERGYGIILKAFGVELKPGQTATNGYADVCSDAHNTALTHFYTCYTFDGKRYRESRSTFVNQETGESKPARVRVKFQRGASSATMSGSVSFGFPDWYVLGARAGQTMTVQLNTPEQKASFLIMGPASVTVADSVTQWTGPLPKSGDYTITVDTAREKTAYTITIAIK